MLVNARRRVLVLWVCSCLVVLAGCAVVFPSRPDADAFSVRNSDDGIELTFCQAGNVELLVASRGEFRGDRVDLPPKVAATSVQPGEVISLLEFIDETADPSLLSPLYPGEQLELHFRFSSGPLEIGVFRPTKETLDAFREESWLLPNGTLSDNPCPEG